MAEATTKITFDEFADNLAEFFDRVARNNETVVVERDGGEAVILKPASVETGSKRKRTKADHKAFLASAGGWSDFDLDTYLTNLYESRNMPPRPPVEL